MWRHYAYGSLGKNGYRLNLYSVILLKLALFHLPFSLKTSWTVFSTKFLLNTISAFKYLIEIHMKTCFKLHTAYI